MMRTGPPWIIPGPWPHEARRHPGVQQAWLGSVCGAGAGPDQRARGRAGAGLRCGCNMVPVRPGAIAPGKQHLSGSKGGFFLWGLNGVPTHEKNPSPLLDKAGFCAYTEWRSSALELWWAMKRWSACNCSQCRGRETHGGWGPEGDPPCCWVSPGKSLSSKICTSWRLEEGKKWSWVFRKRHTGFSHLGRSQKAANRQGAVKCGMFSLLSCVLSTSQVW